MLGIEKIKIKVKLKNSIKIYNTILKNTFLFSGFCNFSFMSDKFCSRHILYLPAASQI